MLGVPFAAVAAVVGMIVLWPTGGSRDAISNAADLGLVPSGWVPPSRSRPLARAATPRSRTRRVSRDHGDPHRRAEEGSLIVLPEINTEDWAASRTSPGDTIILGFEPATNAYFYADLDRQRHWCGWRSCL